jgi:hypothetical protein
VGKYDQRILEIAGAQNFAIGREQLLDIGTDYQIRRRLRTGMLERKYQSAYRIAGSPESWRQDVTLATMAGGKSSVASFRTAAKLLHLPGGEEVIEVSSPRWRRTRHEGVIPHESFHLTENDIMYVDNIPVTRPARTINDMGLLVVQNVIEPVVLDHAMHDVVRRNLVDVESVWREWDRLGQGIRPGSAVIEAMLQRFVPPQGEVDSSPELKLLLLLRAAGFPEPIPQFRVWISPTQWFDLDHTWPELKLFAEFDPYKYHGNWDKYQADALRRLLIRQLGWDGVSVTDDELDSGAKVALAVLRQLFDVRR